ncbi:hypothetical protein T07_158 [Trichinella nelsoni]|uniref:Uncharacterized protein n=1 Tax=Trichinella nelsoni TaxID=6336 RepID=A0A0V0S0R2_9BILA|nr:hypothetical protein T07_158 [Trichinella nelsoni]
MLPPPFGSDGDRTRDLRFTRPTPYHLATEPPINFSPKKKKKLIVQIRPQSNKADTTDKLRNRDIDQDPERQGCRQTPNGGNCFGVTLTSGCALLFHACATGAMHIPQGHTTHRHFFYPHQLCPRKNPSPICKGVEVEATVGLANGQLTERRRYGRSRHSKAGLPAGAPGDHVT